MYITYKLYKELEEVFKEDHIISILDVPDEIIKKEDYCAKVHKNGKILEYKGMGLHIKYIH